MKRTIAALTALFLGTLVLFARPALAGPGDDKPAAPQKVYVGVWAARVSETSQILPDTNLITLSDRLHILGFAVIFITLVESTISLRVWSSGHEETARRMDRISFWALGGLFVAGSAVAVIVS